MYVNVCLYSLDDIECASLGQRLNRELERAC